jgi:Flp pilus assembly pilin Flp
VSIVGVWWARCRTSVRRRIGDERGASLVEYALLLALIGVVCVAAITFIGNQADQSFSSTGSAFDN